jgi:hypothetical protein
MIQDSMRQEMRMIARQLGAPSLEEQLSRIPESEYGELAKKLLLADMTRHGKLKRVPESE